MERPNKAPGDGPSRRSLITKITVATAAASLGIFRSTLLASALLVPVLASAQPQAARDLDWPCQQIKVPNLSLAAVWAGPAVDPDDTGWRDNPAVAEAVQKLAPRRVPLDQAQAIITDFARHAGDQKQSQLLRVLVGLFNVLDQERSSVMAGLDRFGARQKQLASEIRGDTEKLHSLQADTGSDAETAANMTEQVKWEVEVFQDRREALSYACEVPGKIEQRLFALAREIQQGLE